VLSAPQNDQLEHLLATNATQRKMVLPVWGPLISAPRVVAKTMRVTNFAPILATFPPQFTPQLKEQLHASYNISFTTMCLFYGAFPKSQLPTPEYVHTPSWVAFGIHDPYLLPQNADVGQWVNLQEVLLYDCGHYPQVELPAQVQGDIETIAEIVLGE
jgi:pimeloyl-ACP methyl ester carboxylesterase